VSHVLMLHLAFWADLQLVTDRQTWSHSIYHASTAMHSEN